MLALVFVAAVAAGCSSGGNPAQSPVSASSRIAAAADPLAGTFATGQVTEADIYGLPFGKDVAAQMVGAGNVVFRLRMADNYYSQYQQADGSPPELGDNGTYAIDGSTVAFVSYGGGSNTYQWSLHGQTLRLVWLRSKDDPEPLFGRVIWSGFPYTRVK